MPSPWTDSVGDELESFILSPAASSCVCVCRNEDGLADIEDYKYFNINLWALIICTGIQYRTPLANHWIIQKTSVFLRPSFKSEQNCRVCPGLVDIIQGNVNVRVSLPCHPEHSRPAQISWTSQIREIQEISSNDGHLQPPSYPQINCTTACLDTSYLTNNVLEHWFHSCGHLGSFKRLEFLLKWVKWHSRWFPGFCAVSVCQPLLSLCDWYLDMGIFHQTYYSDHFEVSCLRA